MWNKNLTITLLRKRLTQGINGNNRLLPSTKVTSSSHPMRIYCNRLATLAWVLNFPRASYSRRALIASFLTCWLALPQLLKSSDLLSLNRFPLLTYAAVQLFTMFFEETGDFCRASKRKCVKHYCWEKLRRAEIDLQRIQQVCYFTSQQLNNPRSRKSGSTLIHPKSRTPIVSHS